MIKYNKKNINCNCNRCSCGLCCTEINNLSVKKGEEEILKDINLNVNCGELMAIIGQNGAGKSTLLKVIIGEDSYSGNLYFTDGDKKLSRKPIIGYVPQKLDFDYSSPISVLDFFCAIHSNRPSYLHHSEEVKDKCIQSLIKVNGEGLINKKLGVLSGGELQRVLLALALEPTPDILLLDEPISGIDQNGLKMFYNIVSDLRRNYDLSIILVSHDFNLVAKYADCAVFLNNKTIECIGTPKEVFEDEKVIDVFGLEWNTFIDKRRKGVEENVTLV
ncbi:metal ABC transporter ATP-binding protein [Romboutsia sp.]|uniref:metal ABC transporter ATP-binding protein n=1 Tax=Romboutsia sp. TaxID=1965302 RepID=UPI003F310D70